MRDVLRRFRSGQFRVAEVTAELALGRTRFYELYASYLAATVLRRALQWSPAASGGNHRAPLAAPVTATLRKLLGSSPSCSYSFAASEILRRHDTALDRATVRRWQVSHIGQLWQYDASPHRWFADQDRQPSLIEIIDDHSRLLPGAQLYERDNLLAHLHFLPTAFRAHGLPLALSVDYHSFFFTSTPDALTQLGAALRFYEVSLRNALTPQAKGKIERAHDFWQKRLPPLFTA